MRHGLLLGQPERHPFEVGLVGLTPALQEVALGARGVVLRAGGPGVVGHLMVVEDRDPGVHLVRQRRVGVGLVQRMPQPVAAQVDGLGLRYVVALADQALGTVPVGAVAVLVDVVADMKHEVEVVAASNAAVRREVPARVVAAGHQCQPKGVHLAGLVRGGLGASDRAELAAGPKPVPVAGVGLEVVDVDLDRVVTGRAGSDPTLGHDLVEVRVQRHLPAHAHRLAAATAWGGNGLARRRRGRGPGPDHDGFCGGVTARDPVAEDAAGRRRRCGVLVEQPQGGQDCGGADSGTFEHTASSQV